MDTDHITYTRSDTLSSRRIAGSCQKYNHKLLHLFGLQHFSYKLVEDIELSENIYTSHLDEVIAGKGNLNYHTFSKELSKPRDIPLIMEYLKTVEEYPQVADHIRSVATEVNVII